MEKKNKIATVYFYLAYTIILIVCFSIYFLKNEMPIVGDSFKYFASSISMLYMIVSIPAVLWLYNKKVKKSFIENDENRLENWFRWTKNRIIVIGISLLINAVLYFLLRSESFLYALGISALAMLFCKPRIDDLNINESDNDDTQEVKS